MADPRGPWLVRTLRRMPLAGGAVAVAVAAVVLFGWAVGSEVLKGVLPGFGTMKPNTALGFLSLGGALWLLSGTPRRGRVWLAEALAAFAGLLHGATLLEYLLRRDLGIDTLLFPDPASSLTLFPGRPSPATATNFTLGALAILLRDRRGPGETAPSRLLAAAMGLIAFTVLGTYLLGVEPFYGLAVFFTGMALHTAVTFLLLALGILFLHADTGILRSLLDPGTSGLLARRLVPATLLLPLAVGLLVGLGRRIDLYDDAFALTVTPLLMLVGFAVILYASLAQVVRFESAQREILDALRHSNQDLEGRVGRRTRDLEGEKARYRELADTLQAILSASQDPILVFDRDLRLAYVNPSAPAQVGMTVDDFLGKTLTEVGLDMSVLGALEDDVRAVFWDGVARSSELIHPLPQGTGHYEYAATPITDDKGNVRQVLVLSRDVTVRRRVERERLEAEKQAMELDRLRQEDESRLQFINTAAHELSTPLTPLVLELEMLRRMTTDDVRAAKAVARMARNVGRLRGLVHDMLLVARLQAGQLRVDPGPVDMLPLLERRVAAWQDPAADKGLALSLDAGPAQVLADGDRLEEVLDHLLANAVKFTGAGSIEVSGQAEGDRYRVTVQDTGMGFGPGQEALLFRPFSQVHDVNEITDPGSGLGLFICKGLLDRQDGTIEAHSDGVGQGARVSFTLPRVL